MDKYASRSGSAHYKFKHGSSGGKSKLYGIWQAMRNRCRNPKVYAYKSHGGRGITVCDEWADFPAFRDWALANGYQDGLSIERDNIDGNYCPDNCRWIPRSQQPLNTRRIIRVEIDGKTMNLKQAAKLASVPYSTVREKVRRGIPPLEALRLS